jgi:hypothetical protein
MSETQPTAPAQSDADRLVALGLHPLWLAMPAHGVPQSGKAPIGGKGWQSHPWDSVAPRQPFVGANLGVQTGYVEGAPVQVVVLDCDSPEALAWANTNVPSTPMVTITGKGEHRFYKRPAAEEPGSVGGKVKLKLTESDGSTHTLDLDVKGDGGQVVAAPSIHYSGHQYREAAEWTPELLASIPVWNPQWVGSRTKGAHSAARIDSDTLQRPGQTLASIRARVKFTVSRTRDFGPGIDAPNVLAALTATFDGLALQPAVGRRGSTLRDVCWVLCRQCPEARAEELVAYLTPSIQSMGDGWETDADWGIPGALAKIATARRKLADDDAARLATLAPTSHPLAGLAALEQSIDSEPTEQPPVSVSSLLIVTHPRADLCWLRRPDGYYREGWALRAAYQYRNHESGLKWASELGLADWWEQTPKGPKPKTPERVFAQYSTPLEPSKYRLSLVARDNAFDPLTGAFVEARSPLRTDIVPKYDAQLDRWLQLLGGAEYPRLVDWLSTCTRVGEPTPALAVIGQKGCGKGFLIEGLSRLWFRMRAPAFASIVGDHNESLAKSPLLIADEYLPQEGPHKSDIFEFIRELVTLRTHTVNPKNLPVVQVEGCVRLVYASNKPDSLNIRNANVAAKEALAERFVYIDAMGPLGAQARDYLQGLPPAVREGWIERDGFAAHCLWLAEHHTVAYRGRLLVEGNGQGLIDLASNSKGPTGHLCEALCRFLLEPSIVRNHTRDHFLLEGGDLWVATRAFEDKETWEALVPSQDGRRHSTSVLGTGLAMLSTETRRKRYVGARSHKPIQAVMHKVDVAQVLAFAGRTGLGDTATIMATLGNSAGLVAAAMEPPGPPAAVPVLSTNPQPPATVPMVAPTTQHESPRTMDINGTFYPGMPDPGETVVGPEAPAVAVGPATAAVLVPMESTESATTAAAVAARPRLSREAARAKREEEAAAKLVAKAARAGAAAAKKAAKAIPKWERVVAQRGEDYATPTELHPMLSVLLSHRPTTPEATRALCQPFLLAAAPKPVKGATEDSPLTYARLVLAQRAYLRALVELPAGLNGTPDTLVAGELACSAWQDNPHNQGWQPLNTPVMGK